ncbi:MAG: hypothetical protein LBB84_10875 [Tannerellaceae bacterium]|jgi:hypothetical protein|nr:hypothetical protein [Tannerellaceae bacterium]
MKLIQKIEALNALSEGINPTIVYNEGWMVRLLVMQSIEQKITIDNIDFGQFRKWTSEAQISSPFSGSELKKDNLNETRTHADVVIGDFDVNFDDNAGIRIKENAKIIGIIEAKMGSNLSQGTKNTEFKNYNQVSRSICCLAFNVVPQDCSTFVFVVAPKSTLEKHKISEQITNTEIKEQIRKRLEETESGKILDLEKFNTKVKNCKVLAISFEEWIEKIDDKNVKTKMSDFYDKCKKYNTIK